jgi:transcriptional regulator with PAS, ATPase and Fis domain
VLILGATGSGKEGLVKYLHACGPRSANKIITKNCGAFPDDLIESELFGYIKGAFTGANKEGRMGAFEEAQDSTLFLDEVGELSLNAQTRLLRVLQEKEITRVGDHIKNSIKVNCRIVAATHRNLWQSVQEGRFRADLYYRLAGLIITLDDLSKRPEDLVRMIDRFWQETVDVNPGFPGRTLSDDARRRLLAHNWPGNVRELIGALVRIAFLAKKPEVTAEDVELSLAGVESAEANISIQQLTTESLSSPKTSAPPGLNLKEQLKNYQRQLIEEAITRAEGNKSGAARELGVSYQHLNRLLKD